MGDYSFEVAKEAEIGISRSPTILHSNPTEKFLRNGFRAFSNAAFTVKYDLRASSFEQMAVFYARNNGKR